MRNIILLTLSLSIFISCMNGDKAKVSNSIQEINIKKDVNNISDISDLSNSIQFIKLETNPECLIGNINKIINYNGFYYILDNRYANALFKFNAEGKYIDKIHSVGKGPGQYLKLQDFCIDKKNGIIYLYDISQRQLLSYDFKFNYLSSTKINIAAFNMEYAEEYFYFRTNKMFTDASKRYELIITDIKGKVVNRYLEFDENETFRLEIEKTLIKFENGILFSSNFINTLYKVQSDNILIPRFRINFENPIPIEYTKDPLIFSTHGTKFSFIYGNFCETNNHVYFSYFDDKIIKDVFIDKRNNNYFLFHHLTNKTYGQDFLPKPIGSDENQYFIYVIKDIGKWIPDYSLHEKLESINYSNVDSLIDNFKADDNPILMLIHLK